MGWENGQEGQKSLTVGGTEHTPTIVRRPHIAIKLKGTQLVKTYRGESEGPEIYIAKEHNENEWTAKRRRRS